MIWAEGLAALAISVVLTVLFVLILGWRRTGAPDEKAGRAFWFFLLLVFLVTWAGGAWLTPFGPTSWGVSWLGFVLVAVAITLLLGALVPPRRPIELSEGQSDSEVAAGISIFFWVLLVLLLVAAVVAYSSVGPRRVEVRPEPPAVSAPPGFREPPVVTPVPPERSPGPGE